MHFRSLIGAAMLAGILNSAIATADVSLPPVISTHMVLQKCSSVPIWGSAAPSEHVVVTMNGVKGQTDAASDGKWRVKLDLHDQSAGPFDLTVQGKNLLTVHDVLVGEVWLCGGQSNMEMPVKRTMDAEKEVAASANSQIRLFQCKAHFALTPQDQVDGTWTIAGPTTTGNYTAVGYYFAKKVNHELRVPVGLLSCNFGGSAIESWMSIDALAQDADLKTSAESLLHFATVYPQALKDYQSQFAAWQAKYHREDKPAADPAAFAAPDVSTIDWKPARSKEPSPANGLPDAGAVWFRTTVDVPTGQAGIYLPLHLTGVHDFDTVYWDGHKIGSTTADQTTSFNDSIANSLTRRYDVPGTLVKSGSATLAIRVFAPAGGIGFSGVSGAPAGPFLTKVEYALPALDPAAVKSYPQHPPIPAGERNLATTLYNGMLHPLIPYAIRGVLWYQGEANVGRAVQYRKAFPLLIKDWREKWGEGDFPFYFCQLANMQSKRSTAGDSATAELREAQTMALSLVNTGQAILIDLGEADDVHFRNKKEAGERLARIALANSYGKAIPFSAPMYDSMTVEGISIRLHFSRVDQGLVAKQLPAIYALKSTLPADQPLIKNSPDSELQGFMICGNDRKWIWANAKIDAQTVLVSSPQISHPVAVRYAWADNPTCNLYSSAGLPVCPFRTDDFPLVTAKNKY
jgi:sialate O-acetylesterase